MTTTDTIECDERLVKGREEVSRICEMKMNGVSVESLCRT
jgi:hypothetical protein